MARGDSLDLRSRVIADLARGMSAEHAAHKYIVSARTVYAWKRLHRQTGSVAPRQGKTGPKRKLAP